jgi:cell division protein FtsL
MAQAQLRRLWHVVGIALVVALVVGLYKAKTDAARTQSHVRELEREVGDEDARVRALRAEVARLESPENVERLARERLGLEPGAEGRALPERALAERLPPPRAADVNP